MARTPGRLLEVVDTDQLPDLPDVPVDLMAALRRAVAMDPALRHKGAAELRDALVAA